MILVNVRKCTILQHIPCYFLLEIQYRKAGSCYIVLRVISLLLFYAESNLIMRNIWFNVTKEKKENCRVIMTIWKFSLSLSFPSSVVHLNIQRFSFLNFFFFFKCFRLKPSLNNDLNFLYGNFFYGSLLNFICVIGIPKMRRNFIFKCTPTTCWVFNFMIFINHDYLHLTCNMQNKSMRAWYVTCTKSHFDILFFTCDNFFSLLY